IQPSNSIWLLGYGVASFSGGTMFSQPQRLSNEAQLPTIFDTNLRVTTQAGKGRVCVGDSGGPAVNTFLVPNTDIAVGVASNFDSSNPWCPAVGNWFRHAHTANSASFIQAVHNNFLSGPCSQSSAPFPYGWFNYQTCWFG